MFFFFYLCTSIFRNFRIQFGKMNVIDLVQDSQDMNKAYAAMFAPFWNEIIKSLREEDFISNRLVKRNWLLDNV